MKYLLGPFVFIVSLAIISGLPATGGTRAGDCGEPDKMTFENWPDWVVVTPQPVRSEGHSNNWVRIFVNSLAEAVYLRAGAPYPPCAAILKPVYISGAGENAYKMTVMVKMAPGYDRDHGDWFYAVFDKTGTKSKRQGKLGDCIACHKQAAETDYLFSKEVMSARPQ